MEKIYLQAYTVEIGFAVLVHWNVSNARRYHREHYGREGGVRRGKTTVTVYQDFYQWHCDPLSKFELQLIAKKHLNGEFKSYSVALG